MKWNPITRRKMKFAPISVPEGSLLLDRVQAASLLSVSPSTLDRLAASGQITPIRVRRRILYARSEVTAFAQRNPL